jgi:hypothetical protein
MQLSRELIGRVALAPAASSKPVQDTPSWIPIKAFVANEKAAFQKKAA